MIEYLIIFFMSIVVMYADLRMTAHNFGAVMNGYGSIKYVLDGAIKQPMAYRVLIPWICRDNKTNYVLVKYLSILFALLATNLWFDSLLLTSLMAMFFVLAAIYDYTDGYLEVGFFASSFWLILYQPNYSWEILFVIVYLAALNRETSVFIPICAFLSGDVILSMILFTSFLIGYGLPRIYYGRRGRYCEFNMIPKNIKRIKEAFKTGMMLREYILFFMLTLVICIAPFIGHIYIPFEIGMYIMFIVLLVPTVWAEIRVFKPVMLVVIPMIAKGVI